MEYWQAFQPRTEQDVFTDSYAAPMPNGLGLGMPLRDYGSIGVAGFIANQASFPVIRAICGWMAEAARPLGADIVVGMPTLGHGLAAQVAEALGHENWVAPGYSRKKWYDPALSVPTASSTAPDARRVWLDPALLPRLSGRRVLLLDDVISTGSSALAGLALLASAGVRPIGLCVAMVQGDRWREAWPSSIPVAAAFATPLLHRAGGSWVPDPATVPGGLLLPRG